MFLKDELEQNGIASCIPELISCNLLSQELDYALRPNLHERKIQPYGFIVCNHHTLTLNKELVELPYFELDEARNLADGCHSFLVFTEGQFKGMLILEQAVNSELKLCQLQEDLDSVICTTDIQGVTKIICNTGVFIHEYRQWRRKPSVKLMMKKILTEIPDCNPEILQSILEFCFHELSPRNIGNILVWCLSPQIPSELISLLPNTSLGNVKKNVEVKINSSEDLPILRHVLMFTDGATLLDYEGNIIGIGIHLKYSETSLQLVLSYKGTRHTSAKRFSYDFPETLIFVVSDDGPVTIFCQGMSIGNLEECFCRY
ncbi:hypothetical protein PCC7424_2387 [Gloeothece citriformis PCC 7424]|uniref:DAC domain-containing protein n=1 Tax=Gloeothece citriformis (strain PCC 7424) TaxID=65393 RepID=B7KIX2_GLOC7|nr:diadenylate cyclase [Gloeothece citriformis]ACK70808.1 hypothetical protein PCC7424_2387 [Gloeothece citriformis PCC 7424]